MRIILDTSVVLGEGQSSFRYFSELIPRLKKHPDLTLDILPSPYFELPLDWYGDKPAYQLIQKKMDWIPRGQFRKLFSPAKRFLEQYRQKKALYRSSSRTVFHSFYYTHPLDSSVPLVTIAHDAIPELFPDKVGQGPYLLKHLKEKESNLKSASRIIAVSESTKKDICNFYNISPNQVDVIYHSVSSDFFVESHSQHMIDHPYLLQVGGRRHHRNFYRLLEALKADLLYKDFLLVCAGDRWSPEEQDFIRQLGLDGRIKLIESPSNQVLRNLYQHALMLVYPSLYEGFGFPPLEAMACGTPVVTSQGAGAIPEVSGDAAFYFDPHDPSDIAKAIRAVLDPQVSDALRAKGFSNIKRFSWDVTAEQTIRSYKTVLNS